MDINKEHPVMVTGATGYVAGHLIKKLLEHGLTIHATVRNSQNKTKLRYLEEIAEKNPGQIKFYDADLLSPGSFDQAMKGCQIVFHTASPFTMNVSDPQKDLIDPAKIGTSNVFESANKTDSVRKVVLTSSCVAIYGDNIDLKNSERGVLTENDWNTSSNIHNNPYAFSKTVAEKEAWNIANKQSRWQLVVINPSLVMGPGINPFASSESFNIIKQFGDGTLKHGVPNWGMGVVDVRDVAEAHIQAAFNPKAKGRYITSGHNTSFPEMAKTLVKKFGDSYPIPRKTLPKWIVWLLGPISNPLLSRRTISRNVGHQWKANNTKSKEELGITYLPLEKTMNDFFQQMVEHQAFTK